jgi:hypothetical protein
MEVHNNSKIAAIFRKLAAIRSEHREEIARRGGDIRVGCRVAQFDGNEPEGPELVDLTDLHYKMMLH